MTPLRGAHPALPLRAGPAFAQSRCCHSNGVGCLSDPWLASVCAAGARAQRARRLTQARSAQRQSASVGDSTEPASLGSGASRRHEVHASPSPAWLLAPQARRADSRLAPCAAGSPGLGLPGCLRRRLARPPCTPGCSRLRSDPAGGPTGRSARYHRVRDHTRRWAPCPAPAEHALPSALGTRCVPASLLATAQWAVPLRERAACATLCCAPCAGTRIW